MEHFLTDGYECFHAEGETFSIPWICQKIIQLWTTCTLFHACYPVLFQANFSLIGLPMKNTSCSFDHFRNIPKPCIPSRKQPHPYTCWNQYDDLLPLDHLKATICFHNKSSCGTGLHGVCGFLYQNAWEAYLVEYNKVVNIVPLTKDIYAYNPCHM